ncbi:uncharacterized protein LOC131346900 isoform X4 [Hemibagrus wyckioides]|uniref:uncharacterized protein LOC131346900 isoform X4 n=1 Tax=Hemibagrus wyckioides TaxID=337641 RepID=UPI00266DCAD5|nr:uncharacterized protein LOC131346900 isoform X4 [Hemibagrus wyckioides]
MENISAPLYPGPPLESTSLVDQRPHTPQPAPRTRYNIVEQSPGPQHQRSLPVENIPVPPYPGPPLDFQSTSCVQQRPCSLQPPLRSCYTTVESPEPQLCRSLPMENMPVPPYPGPPLESQSTSSVHQRPCTPQPPTRTCYTTVQQSPGPQTYRSLPVENFPVPPYSLDSQQRPCSLQPPPRTYNTTVECGRHSPGPQHHSSLPIENIPVPPYPGPPLNSQFTSSVQQRAYTPQPLSHTHHEPLEGGPHTPLYSPSPQSQSSLPMHNISTPPYPGPPLEMKHQQVYSNTPCKNAEVSPCNHPHSQIPCQYPAPSGTSGIHRPVHKGVVTPKPAPQGWHDKAEVVSCQNQHCNPTFYFAPNKHSPECMDDKIKAQEFAPQDVPHKHCVPVQGAKFPVDFPTESKVFSMKKMSESLNFRAQAHHLQLESHCSLEKSTIEISTEQHVKVSKNSGPPPPPYPGFDLNQQSPDPLHQLQPDTSASMYTYTHPSVIQPRVQVVQAGRSQVVIQPQRQTVVMPAPQPTVVIQPAAPAVRVIQAPAPAVQVIQAPASAVRVIQAPAPAVRVIQSPSSAVVYPRYY